MADFAVFANPCVRAEPVITAVITWAGQMANLLPASLEISMYDFPNKQARINLKVLRISRRCNG